METFELYKQSPLQNRGAVLSEEEAYYVFFHNAGNYAKCEKPQYSVYGYGTDMDYEIGIKVLSIRLDHVYTLV